MHVLWRMCAMGFRKTSLILLLLFISLKAEKDNLRVEVKKKVPDCKRRSQKGDTITWNYKGTLVNGVEFDKGSFGSYTATLGEQEVIEGVDRGMMKMCVGEKRKMTIPHHMAYGAEGTGNIPGYSTLIFDVELKSIYRPGEDPDPEDEIAKEVKITIKKEKKDCKIKSQKGDTITWDYKGTLEKNGKEFDRGEYSATLGKAEVIKGVDIGMKGMCVGDKRRMVIPAHLGYGDDGYSDLIPGGATLVFDVELKKIYRPEKGEL